MKYLITTALEYGLEKISDRALQFESVHGIIVDLHPFWLMAYKSMYLNSRTDDLEIGRLYENYHRYYYRNFSNTVNADDILEPFSTTVPIELGWRPPYFADWMGTKNNIRVRIQLRPGSKPINFEGTDQSLNVIQEYSAVPSFSSKAMHRPLEGGTSVGHLSDTPGTLGGILIDTSSGKKYGLTCGHIIRTLAGQVDQPSLLDISSTGSIGSCVYSLQGRDTMGQLCNPRNSNILSELDIALIEIDKTITTKFSVFNVGNIDDYTPANELSPNLRIEFNGRSSGHKSLVTGGIGFVQEIQDSSSGKKYCFKNLIELKQPFMSSLILSRPVQGGDSGAWITTSGQRGVEWCGMIIGENRQSGFAIHSEDIITHLAGKGYNLACT